MAQTITAKSGVMLWMGAAFGIALAVAAVVLGLNGPDNKSVRLALDLTARWSFVLFFLAYAGNALAALFGWRALKGHAREFGLSFAAAHLVHIGLVIWLGVILGRVPLSGGLLLFFLIGLFFTYLLAALSFGGVKALGSFWPPLRFVAMNYILITFARDFISPVIHPKPAQYNVAHFIDYAPFAALSIAAPLLVLAVAYRRPTTPKAD
ncbi:MAG TPA: hypothetical protein VHZ32_15745 [Rhizomicrobium sp.]|jgi:hypothetical protein|nr:hypothetical protein [Rhizomicrobium sp.]